MAKRPEALLFHGLYLMDKTSLTLASARDIVFGVGGVLEQDLFQTQAPAHPVGINRLSNRPYWYCSATETSSPNVVTLPRNTTLVLLSIFLASQRAFSYLCYSPK